MRKWVSSEWARIANWKEGRKPCAPTTVTRNWGTVVLLPLLMAKIIVLPCSSSCPNLLLTQTRHHIVICWATYCSDGNVRESLFIFVTAASVWEKTASKITSVGITYWFVSRFSQSPFYCCSRQGQSRSKITLPMEVTQWGILTGILNSLKGVCGEIMQDWGSPMPNWGLWGGRVRMRSVTYKLREKRKT